MEAKHMLSGTLGRTLYVVHSEPAEGVDPAAGVAYLEEHLRRLTEWERNGVLFAAGPYKREGKPTPRALYILRAASLAEATRLAAEEPLHKHGVRVFTIDEWALNQGRINVSLDFSTQRGGLDGAPQYPAHLND
ncbi:YciI family protein [Sinomonas sp. R1AF57]|jgi:uncharacterized protein YciI|uniref:YciI family protein n=1 Tax=Sinomonas sp. R1AF57 TaxID=2020377 RepID=UPI001ABFCBEA|nr:YciI family protein [Sinomonas sp. R1AF57]